MSHCNLGMNRTTGNSIIKRVGDSDPPQLQLSAQIGDHKTHEVDIVYPLSYVTF